MHKFGIRTSKRAELVDITSDVQKIVSRSKLADGLCFVFCPHTTAGLTINENADPSVKNDIINAFNRIVPADEGYSHAEGNSDSHIKSSIFGHSLTVPVEDSHLKLGTWQGIYFCEGDGPRNREVWVKLIEG